MAAIVTATIVLKDMEKMMAYAAAAAPVVEAHGGEFLYRARTARAMRGEAGHQMAVAIRFPDAQAAEKWWSSDAYNALHDIRDAGADVTFVLHEEL